MHYCKDFRGHYICDGSGGCGDGDGCDGGCGGGGVGMVLTVVS
jgi:hypothetical protein